MGQWLHRIRAFLGLVPSQAYTYPAVDMTLPGGRQLHLVGSIHMGTSNMSPLPSHLVTQLRQADALIVEADISNNPPALFDSGEVFPPLEQRLSAQEFHCLQTLCQEIGADATSFATLPAWQVALMMQAQQAQLLGLRAEYGIDYQLLQGAKAQQIAVIELEGAAEQLAMLAQLPQGGLGLLQDTLTHWRTNARLLQTMVSWWLDSKPNSLPENLPTTFSAELYDILMHCRNRHWQQRLQTLPPGRYVVAVGALHLYGDGNLPALLQEALV
ncbi:conjugal transfer protein TraB [Serratia sp. S1B]|nr:conjugal transfer protein TraB [Serratia sp. S1B]